MTDRERDHKLFYAKPPRMFPHVPHQRPKIAGMLAQLAAVDPSAYEERLKAYNDLCDQHDVDHFPRITVTADPVIADKKPKAEKAVEPKPAEESVVPEPPKEEPKEEKTVEQPVKAKTSKAKKSSTQA